MKKFNYLLFAFVFTSLCGFGQWNQIGQSINGLSADDISGVSESLSDDGSLVAIGAVSNNAIGFFSSGYARVYQNQSGNWVQVGQTLEGDGNFDQSGYTVSLSANGDFLAVAADAYSPSVNIFNRGRVRIYQNQADNWVQVGQDIEGEAAADFFGFSLALSADGTRIAIGAPVNDEGYVKVYENQSGVWTQIGQKIVGEAISDQLGISVSLSADGNTVAIGADLNDGDGFDKGHVRVYRNGSGNWEQVGQDIDGDANEDFFGTVVSLSSDGTKVAIGGLGNDDNGGDAGHVKVFDSESGNWVQIGDDIDGEASGDQLGFSVSLSDSGNIIAIGANMNDGNGDDAGHVRIYRNLSGSWVQIGTDIEGGAEFDFMGQSVAMSADGSIVATGASGNDSGGLNAGQVQIFQNPDILSVQDNTQIRSYSITGKNSKINVLTDQDIRLTVYNILGSEVVNKNLNAGLYLAKITDLYGKITVKKVFVE